MNSFGSAAFSRKLAVILIICAVVGTEISYHFTLESRFDAIEDKLKQDTVALQQFQDSMDAITSSKTETFAGLNKEVDTLQSSVGSVGKATHDQTDALTQLRQQIATLQQAQSDQLDAQKKLTGSLDDMGKNQGRLRTQVEQASAAATVAAAAYAPAPAPAPVTTPAPTPAPVVDAPASKPAPPAANTAEVPAPVTTPAPKSKISHGTMGSAPVTSAPRADEAMDLRSDEPDETGLPSPGMIAAHPSVAASTNTFHSVRALPVGTALSSKN